MSKLAAAQAVAKALGDMGKQVSAFKADISAIDEEKLAGLRATLDKACGKA
jgi:ABC-type sugar transport system substrate-binding protein